MQAVISVSHGGSGWRGMGTANGVGSMALQWRNTAGARRETHLFPLHIENFVHCAELPPAEHTALTGRNEAVTFDPPLQETVGRERSDRVMRYLLSAVSLDRLTWQYPSQVFTSRLDVRSFDIALPRDSGRRLGLSSRSTS